MAVTTMDGDSGRFAQRPARADGHWLLGVLPQMRANPLGFFADMANSHGDAVTLSLAGHKAVMLNHPRYLRHVLQDNYLNYRKSKFYGPLKPMLGGGIFMVEGDRWLKQRRVANPAFQGCKMPALLGAMVDATGQMLDRWRGEAAAGVSLDLAPEMSRVTLDIILRSLLGYRMNDEYGALYDALATLLADAEKRAWAFVSPPTWLPTAGNRACAQAHAVIADLVEKVIAERTLTGEPRDDLLDAFIAAYSNPGAPMEEGGGFQPSILIDEVRSFILAGHETTANAMCWLWLELSRHQDVLGRVTEEIDRELGATAPTLASVQRLPFCRAVLDETLRVHPTVWTISRQANQADTIDDLAIAKDQTVIMSPYAVHHRTSLWGDPETFRPERFLEPRHDPFAYFPFAKGPRHCLGARFAVFEALIIMAMTLQRFDVRVVDPASVRPAPMITLRPDGPVHAHVSPRRVRQAA